MIKKLFYITVLIMSVGVNNNVLAQPPCSGPPCGAGNISVEISITTDGFGNEISWVLQDLTDGGGCGISPFGAGCGAGTSTLGNNTTSTWSICYPIGNNIVFIISDNFGDGLGAGGSWTITTCGGVNLVSTESGNFGCQDSTTFTIPPDCCGGAGCPTCTNGIKDCNEKSVDCGGPCCPDCCGNGIMDDQETGVDCGGPVCAACPPISASDCSEAVPICTDLNFSIQPDGWGLIKEIPALGTIGNPDNANPGGSGNWGCLRTPPPPPPSNSGPENNSTWMTVTITGSGLLGFTFGVGTQTGFFDWIMYPWNPNVCNDIPTGNYAPVRCNWNSNSTGGTGLANPIPAGGFAGNYEPLLPVLCGEKYMIVFSNYSSLTTNVPIQFGGTATVSCAPLELTITVIPPNPVICPGESVTLTASGADTYTWSPATGLSDTSGTSVTANPTVTTTYTVIGTTGCTTGDTTVTVTVNSVDAGFTFSGSQCLPTNNIIFTNTGSTVGSCGAGCPVYTWNFGDGTVVTGNGAADANPTHTFSSAGTYNVSQIINDSTCTATYTSVVNISNPQSLVIGTQESCFGGCDGAADLTVTGGFPAYIYSWSNGATTEDIVGVCAGTYTVTVTDINSCTVTSSVTLTPIVDVISGFTYNGNKCLTGNVYQFTNTGNAPGSCGAACPTYSWDFNGNGTIDVTGTTSAAANPTFTYASAGTYTATQIVEDGSGCTDTTKVTLVVYAEPTASIVGVSSLCLASCNGTADLTVTGGAAVSNYAWSNGATTQDVSGLCAGTYTVTVTDMNGCKATAGVSIPPGTEIKAGFTWNGNQCVIGNTISFTNTGSLPGECGAGCPTYIWYYGDAASSTGNTSAAANPTKTYAAAGTYSVTQIVSNGSSCKDTIIQPVTIYPQPTISIVSTPVSCFGACDGDAMLTVTSGSPPYTYQWSNFETAPNLWDYCAGTYTVTVTDGNGCTVTGSITITEPPDLVVTATGTNITCLATCNGSAGSGVSGGTASYTYLWNDPASQTTATATGLCADTFKVVVTDSKGCKDSASVILTEPPPLITTTPDSSTSCNGICNGVSTTTASGGTGGYTYLWSDPGFQTTATATGLCAGTFRITVTDFNSCIVVDTIIITEPVAIVPTTSSTSAICGNPDGSASVSVTGGTTPYTYIWNPGGQTTDTATGLLAGGYTVTVTDANSCTKTAITTVNDAGGPTINITDSVNISCNTGSDGSAHVSTSGGVTPYTFSWSPSGGTDSTATGLTAGSYTVTVTDNSGCITNATVTITQPAVLTAAILSSVNTSCDGQCDGSAAVSVSGGSGTYTYLWNDLSSQSTSSATGLCANTYIVTVKDSLNCPASDTVIITEPVAVSTSVAGTNVSCFGGNDGAADLTISGGTAPYIYSWSPGAQTTQDITGLSADTFIVTYTDAKACTGKDTIIITEPLILALSTSTTDANCGQANGSATVSASGGTAAYTYLWNDAGSQINDTAFGLPAATYTVTVTDANGCTTTSSATVGDIPGGTASVTVDQNTSGFGICDGQATASMTGGVAPFTYLWDDPASQTALTATGLCADSICVTITDINGCTSTACDSVKSPGQIILSIIGTDVLCNGQCTGAAQLTVTGGIIPYTYLWNPGGLTAEDIINLCSGTYKVTVTDANSNIGIDSVVITEPSALIAAITGTNITCNGVNNGTTDLTVTGGIASYTYSWSPGGAVTQDLSGLAPGAYTATVTDANGCSVTASITLTQPSDIALTISSNNSNCGQADGDATVSASGGVSPYTYLWNDTAAQTTAIATGLTSGSYEVLVKDSSGCSDSATVSVSDIGGGTAGATVNKNVSCKDLCDGQATSSISGGTSPFTYTWDDTGSQTTPSATGLCLGTFNVTITDNVGCISIASVVITEPALLTTAMSKSDPICNGGCNGNATASVSGGSAPYTFVWNDPGSQTTSVATGLCAGTYNVTVTDSGSCIINNSVIISQPLAIIITSTYTPSNCGQADGSATATAANGTSPYSYLWNDPLSQNTQTADSLLSGGYIVTVTDVNSCSATKSVAVSDTTGPSASISSKTDVSCNGGTDGNASVTAVEGSPPYTYSWNTVPVQNTQTATGLNAGDYTATVADINGCNTSATITITEPAVLTVSANAINTSCKSQCDGSSAASASGGTSPYTYSWSDPGNQSTATATGLCAGTYSVIVTDAKNCSDTVSITITEPTAISFTKNITNVSCNGICDGQGTVTPSGGTSPYTYLWDDPASQAGSTANNLCAGTFNVTITDSKGCDTTAIINITEPAAISSTITTEVGVSCNGDCDGYAEVTPSGGTSPYTYLWSNGQTASLANNLCGIIYNVTVTDAKGCTTTNSANINEPAAISNIFTKTNVSCYGFCDGSATSTVSGGIIPYSYLWDDPAFQTTSSATGLCADTFSVFVTDANGCSVTGSVIITQPVAITTIIGETGSNCGLSDGSACVTVSSGAGPFTYLWSDSGSQTTDCATGLGTGTYNLTVTGGTGCTKTDIAVISDLGSPTFSISSQKDASCKGGCDGFAIVLVTGGDAPYTYLWDDLNSQTAASATGLCAGNYIVSVIDSNGCTGNISAVIGEPTELTMTVSSTTNASCNGYCDGTASVLVIGATPPYTYQWFDPGNQTTQTATGLCDGSYLIVVEDSLGCTQSATAIITEPSAIAITTSATSSHCGLADGTATASASGSNGSFGYVWNDPSSQNSAKAVNLLANSYKVVVTDIKGCKDSASVTVNNLPPGVSTISNIINVSCFGGSNGSAQVSMSGGVLPYTYLWCDPASQTTVAATALTAGSYCVNITDSTGCVVSDTAVIIEPAAISVTTSTDSASCYGTCNGTAEAAPSGGTAPYTYLWNDPLAQTSDKISNVCAGVYNVTVTDAKSCSKTTSATVYEPIAISLNETHTDANCQKNDGSGTVTASGGTPSYNFSWMPGGQTSATADSLFAGTYIVTVKDANLCSKAISVTISDLNGPTAFISDSGNVSCFGGNDGYATVSVNGGAPPFIYLWDPTTGSQSAQTAANLVAGTYTVNITDTNNCIASASVMLSEPADIIYNLSLANPGCPGYCNGQAGVVVAGGISPYTYLWNDPASQTTNTATGLCAGSYDLIIYDSKGCNKIVSAVLSDPVVMTVSSVPVDESCAGKCDGSVNATPTNGTAPYTYQWNDPSSQTTANAASLCSGTFDVTVTDAKGCTASSSASVTSPPQLIASISASGDILCSGNCTGFAQSQAGGGVPPYTYSWTDGQTTSQATGLCDTVYVITISDANSCTATASVTITEPQDLIVNINKTNVTCNGDCDGVATANVNGGILPYTYLWNDPFFQTSATADSLCAGSFKVTVTDANSCQKIKSTNISQPLVLNLVLQNNNSSTCGFNNGSACVSTQGGLQPYVINWNDPFSTVGACLFNASAGVYNPIVYDANGCDATIAVTINDIAGPVIDIINTTDVDCGGADNGTAEVFATVSPLALPATYSWKNSSGTIIGTGSIIFGLSGGNYTITVYDANGCNISTNVLINEPQPLSSGITNKVHASCFGYCNGELTVTAGNGTPPYTYSWSPGGQTTANITGLCAGIYFVNISDGNGCNISRSDTIKQPDDITITETVTNVSCNGGSNGSIVVTPAGGTAPYFYSWSPAGGSNQNPTGLPADVYTVTVTDIYACSGTKSIAVTEPAMLTIDTVLYSSTCGNSNGVGIVIPGGGTPAYSYLWSDNQTNDTVTNLTAGNNYNVQVTDANGCQANILLSVTNIPGPSISGVTTDSVSCNGGSDGMATPVISGGTAPLSYLWDDPASQSTITAAGLAAGSVNVTVTDANGCTDKEPGSVKQPNPLTIITAGDASICYGKSATFSATASGGTPNYIYQWSNGPTTQSQTPSPSPLITTIYNITVTDSKSCKATGKFTVNVSAPLNVSATGALICEGETASITANATGGTGSYTYNWLSNGNSSSTQVYTGLSATTKDTIVLSDGCSLNDTAEATITVNPVPVPSFTIGGGGCIPVYVVYNGASSVASTFDWDYGDGTTATGQAPPPHLYSIPDSYDVTLTVTSAAGCDSTLVKKGAVTAYPLPTAAFMPVPQETTIINPLIQFSNASSDIDIQDSVVWFFGDDSDTINVVNPYHIYNDTGTYKIILEIYNEFGCKDTAIREVVIKGEYILFSPSAFTPNSDNKNEYFMPRGIGVDGEEFEMYIYNRWGDLVSTVKGVFINEDFGASSIGWDGKANNGREIAQTDVYVWLVRTKDTNGERHEYVGHVTLLR